jgi:DNA polymerase
VIAAGGAPLIVHNCENWDQAMSRDVFFWNIPHMEAAGYAGILRVHDEFVAETPDEPRYSGEHMAQIIRRPHQWCLDLPLNAKGETLYRYDK